MLQVLFTVMSDLQPTRIYKIMHKTATIITCEDHHRMMRHKKTPSSEETGNDCFNPRSTFIQTMDVLAGNLETKKNTVKTINLLLMLTLYDQPEDQFQVRM